LIFSKKKYYFNPVTLTYIEIKTSRKHRIRLLFVYISLAIGCLITSGYLLNRLFDSPEAMILEERVAIISDEMKKIIVQGKEISASLQNDLFVRDNTYRVILQMDTLSYSLRLAGTGGSAAINAIDMQDDLPYEVNDVIKQLNNQLEIQAGSLKALQEKAVQYNIVYSHLPAIQPVAENDLIMVSTDFGIRSDPFFFTERVHNGLDFVAPEGKNVYATGDGIVTFVRYSRTGYGNEIVIDHRFGFGSRYAHLNAIKVKEGEQIKRGQVIGTVGETGRTTGPHLHYEVLYEHKPVNPSYYFDTNLTREEYAEIINKANTRNNLMH
jgi:murein DD-endopeptidase MepM/ murein hydrolase activator NlpD